MTFPLILDVRCELKCSLVILQFWILYLCSHWNWLNQFYCLCNMGVVCFKFKFSVLFQIITIKTIHFLYNILAKQTINHQGISHTFMLVPNNKNNKQSAQKNNIFHPFLVLIIITIIGVVQIAIENPSNFNSCWLNMYIRIKWISAY